VEILDISVPLEPSLVVYPGDPELSLVRVASISEGAAFNVSELTLGVHSGTHVDAPVHVADGAPGVEQLPLDVLVGHATVVDATAAEGMLTAALLERLELPADAVRLVFKTRNSKLWARAQFAADFVSLAEDAARALVDRGTLLVGIDYLSLGDEAVHRVLLGAGLVGLEGLDLREVEPGEYQLVCAPLRLVGADGAPARAFLLR
jgi:arylformamidase